MQRRQEEDNEKERVIPVGLLHKDKLNAHDPLACRVTEKMKTEGGARELTER